MNEKNITLIIKQKNNTRKMVIGISTALVIVTALTGCSKESELLKMIQNGDMIEIEVAVPEDTAEISEEALAWIILANLTSNNELRAQWDDLLNITKTQDGKNGCLYVDADGNNVNNNSLRVALHNRAFLAKLEDMKTVKGLAEAAELAYTDIDSEENQDAALMMALNGYFELLPIEEGTCDANDALNRKEFMTLVTRADSLVDDGIASTADFDSLVGASKFNPFAYQVSGNSYLDLASKSLNNKTYNGTMTRGEAIYLVVSKYFGNELANFTETRDIKFSDCTNGGNIAASQKFIKDAEKLDYYRDYEMVYAISNPDGGAPEEIYKAMVVAKNHGLVSEDTRWDEGITRYEAIKLVFEALKQDASMQMFNIENGKTATVEITEEVKEADELNLEEGVDTSIQEEPKKETESKGDGLDEEREFFSEMVKNGEITQERMDELMKELEDYEARKKDNGGKGGILDTVPSTPGVVDAHDCGTCIASDSGNCDGSGDCCVTGSGHYCNIQ